MTRYLPCSKRQHNMRGAFGCVNLVTIHCPRLLAHCNTIDLSWGSISAYLRPWIIILGLRPNILKHETAPRNTSAAPQLLFFNWRNTYTPQNQKKKGENGVWIEGLDGRSGIFEAIITWFFSLPLNPQGIFDIGFRIFIFLIKCITSFAIAIYHILIFLFPVQKSAACLLCLLFSTTEIEWFQFLLYSFMLIYFVRIVELWWIRFKFWFKIVIAIRRNWLMWLFS